MGLCVLHFGKKHENDYCGCPSVGSLFPVAHGDDLKFFLSHPFHFGHDIGGLKKNQNWSKTLQGCGSTTAS